jgi:F0F1-type ATP synthase gamma subunit
LEAKASKHSARTVAIKSAVDNAGSGSQEFELEYNNARRSVIANDVMHCAASATESSEMPVDNVQNYADHASRGQCAI